MSEHRWLLPLAASLTISGACSNSVQYGADGQYSGYECRELAAQLGRNLDEEVTRIDRTGRPLRSTAARRHPPVIRDLLALNDTGLPRDEHSLRFTAPVGLLFDFG